jgi:predicted DCC family thiol-disulfide oxidoreductase YuxK
MAGKKVETTIKVIYFDGVCNLCDGFISFLFRLGLPSGIKVSSLQGEYAKGHLPAFEREKLDSVLYQTPHGLYRESGAVIRILSDLKFYFAPIKIFLLVPSFLRDPFYRIIARSRYRLFGKKETCRLPTEKEKDFFI